MVRKGKGSEKAKGKVEEVAGAVQGAIGRLIGDHEMEARGRLKEVQGEARQASARAHERVEGAVQEVGGQLKRGIGDLIGDEPMALEGQAAAIEGRARRDSNQ